MYGHSAADGQSAAGLGIPYTTATSGSSTIVTSRATPDHVVKLNHVSAIACAHNHNYRLSDIPFLRRAMNINVASKRVRILRFESAQPENACHDRIAPGRIDAEQFTGAPAIFEHSAERRTIADFFRDFQFAERGPRLPGQSPRPNFEVETG